MYSPALTDEAVITLRRLAWAAGKPMTKTVSALIESCLSFVDPSSVCEKCRDTSKCDQCLFSKAAAQPKVFDNLKFNIEIKEDFHMRPKQISVLISKKIGKDFCSWSVSHGVTAELESEDYYEDAINMMDAAMKRTVSQSLPMGPSGPAGSRHQKEIPAYTTTA